MSWARLGEKISFGGKDVKRLVAKVLRLRCLLDVEVKSLGFRGGNLGLAQQIDGI